MIFNMNPNLYRKALVPILVAVFLAGASHFGINSEMSVKEVVTLIVTGGLVWLTPNKTA